jgi:hypothetical protein
MYFGIKPSLRVDRLLVGLMGEGLIGCFSASASSVSGFISSASKSVGRPTGGIPFASIGEGRDGVVGSPGGDDGFSDPEPKEWIVSELSTWGDWRVDGWEECGDA